MTYTVVRENFVSEKNYDDLLVQLNEYLNAGFPSPHRVISVQEDNCDSKFVGGTLHWRASFLITWEEITVKLRQTKVQCSYHKHKADVIGRTQCGNQTFNASGRCWLHEE